MSGYHFKILRSIILGLISILALGCVEYDEKLWLENDLSGHLIYSFGFPDMGDGKEDESGSDYEEFNIQDKVDSIEGLHLISRETFTVEEKNTYYVKVELEFDHVHLLNLLNTEWLGSFQISRSEDGNIFYHRYVNLFDSSPGEDDQIFSVAKNAMLNQYDWTYTTYFPSRIIGENGFDHVSGRNVNYVTWQYSLSAMLNAGRTMEAAYLEKNFLKRMLKSPIKGS